MDVQIVDFYVAAVTVELYRIVVRNQREIKVNMGNVQINFNKGIETIVY